MQIFDQGRFAPDEVCVRTLAALRGLGSWRTEALRAYGQPLLLWFARGQGRLFLAGRVRGWGPATLAFLPPGTLHGFELPPGAQGFLVRLPRHADAWPRAPAIVRINHAQSQAELQHRLQAVAGELDGNAPDRRRAVEAHLMLLSVWLARHLPARPLPGEAEGPTEALVRRYAELVERHFAEAPTIAALARRLGVTPTHLSRACRRHAGQSAHAILRARIHAEARYLLADTERPVAEIARALGYRSASWFSRDFHASVGLTPTVFRRRHRTPAAQGTPKRPGPPP